MSYCLKYVECIAIVLTSFRAFIMIKCDILPQAFPGFVDMTSFLLTLSLHVWCFAFISSCVLKQLYILDIKSAYIPFLCNLDNLCVHVDPGIQFVIFLYIYYFGLICIGYLGSPALGVEVKLPLYGDFLSFLFFRFYAIFSLSCH